MEWYEDEVAALERTSERARTSGPKAVFYGSSSIRMWSTLSEDLDSDAVLNLGFGGSTLAACVHFFERLVPPAKPASLVVYAGDNDIGDGRTPEQVRASFLQLMARVDSALGSVPFAFLGIKPSPARLHLLDRIVRANSEIALSMATRNCPSVYIDTVGPMLDRLGKPNATYFQDDGLHLSLAGYRLWAQLLRPYRKQLLIQLKQNRKFHPIVSEQDES